MVFWNGIGLCFDLLVFLFFGVWFEVKVLVGVKVVFGIVVVDGVRINGRGFIGRIDLFFLFIFWVFWIFGRNFGMFFLLFVFCVVFWLVGVLFLRDCYFFGGCLVLVCVVLFLLDLVIFFISWGNLLLVVWGIFDFLFCFFFMLMLVVVWDFLIEILVCLGGGWVGRDGGVKYLDIVGNDLDIFWDYSLGLFCFFGFMFILVFEIVNIFFVDEYVVFFVNVFCFFSKLLGWRLLYIWLVMIEFCFLGKFVFLNYFICFFRFVFVVRWWILKFLLYVWVFGIFCWKLIIVNWDVWSIVGVV